MKKALSLILNNKYSKVKYKKNIFYLEKRLGLLSTKKYKQELQEYEVLNYAKIYCKNKNIENKINWENDIKNILDQIIKIG